MILAVKQRLGKKCPGNEGEAWIEQKLTKESIKWKKISEKKIVEDLKRKLRLKEWKIQIIVGFFNHKIL